MNIPLNPARINTGIKSPELRTVAAQFLTIIPQLQEDPDDTDVAVALDDLCERHGEEIGEAMRRVGHRVVLSE